MCNAGGTPGSYQLLTPAYYDQNGQIFMNNGRQLGHVVRLVSPGPPTATVLMTGQQGKTCDCTLLPCTAIHL